MNAGKESENCAELVAIYEISKILNSSLDLGKTLREVLGVLSAWLHMRRGMVSLVQESGELHAAGAYGLTVEEIRRGRYQAGEGVVGRILTSGAPIVIPDIAKEPRFLNRTRSRNLGGDGTIAFIGVPIKVGRDTLGVLSVDRERRPGLPPARFERDVQVLKMVANLIGQTVRLHRSVLAEHARLMQESHRLQKALRDTGERRSLQEVVGQSREMQQVFAEVHQAAPGRSIVLLRGESGTGKEVIAQAMHNLSPRAAGPFVRVNCAALSETLLESELFGHEKGAFTGATQERKGRFELAHNGTLFMDEIGEISPSFQTKLLRVLQEREFERVGGSRSIRVDVRLIFATNRNLEEAVSRGLFREDLYYRINVVTIFLPPLRERREDIPLLAKHFLDKFNKDNQRQLRFLPEALRILMECGWPGNVRELQNCIERGATMARGESIGGEDLPCKQGKCLSMALHEHGTTRTITLTPLPAAGPLSEGRPPQSERAQLIAAMEQCGWVQAKAARLLKLTPRQIAYALRKHNIPIKRF
ncbi:MAG: nif-specific transcriptional activator NifA [Gammaproteobacteria bacterium]|nr:nif-specific transcriptional activator NifA [Gammaproteobacteria bacterium]